MKVGIAGAGAVGCHYGVMLQQGGMDVVYLTRGEHLKALKQQGLTHISLARTIHLSVEATDAPQVLSVCDVIIFACKTTGLEAMCAQLVDVASKDCVLLTVQNGVQAPELVKHYFPNNAIIAASAFIGVRVEKPGVILHSAAGHIRLGVYQSSDRAQKLLHALIQVWKVSGMDAAEPDDVQVMLWHKMLWNCGFNAITALTHRFAKDIAGQPDTVRWVRDAMTETLSIASVQGVKLSPEAIEQHIALTLKSGEVKTSMWQDIEHGKSTEIAAMNGYISTQAKALNLKTPVNDLLASLIVAADQ